jgi:hypothetical protein
MNAFRQGLILFSLWVLALGVLLTVLWMLTLQ